MVTECWESSGNVGVRMLAIEAGVATDVSSGNIFVVEYFSVVVEILLDNYTIVVISDASEFAASLTPPPLREWYSNLSDGR